MSSWMPASVVAAVEVQAFVYHRQMEAQERVEIIMSALLRAAGCIIAAGMVYLIGSVAFNVNPTNAETLVITLACVAALFTLEVLKSD